DGAVMALTVNPQNASTIYASTQKSGIFQSTDGGMSWSAVNAGLSNGFTRVYNYISLLAIDAQDPNTLYAAGHSDCGDCDEPPLYKSVDAGANWTSAASGLPTGIVASLAVDPVNQGSMYAGTPTGIFASTDGGASWHVVKFRLTSDR